MKQGIAILTGVVFFANAFCQRGSAEYYDVKSRHLRNAGLVLVVSGGSLSLVGIALIAKENTLTDGNHNLTSQANWGILLIIVGGGLALNSTPFYVFSSIMHKRSVRITRAAAFLEMEKVPPATFAVIHTQSFPALGIRIAL